MFLNIDKKRLFAVIGFFGWLLFVEFLLEQKFAVSFFVILAALNIFQIVHKPTWNKLSRWFKFATVGCLFSVGALLAGASLNKLGYPDTSIVLFFSGFAGLPVAYLLAVVSEIVHFVLHPPPNAPQQLQFAAFAGLLAWSWINRNFEFVGLIGGVQKRFLSEREQNRFFSVQAQKELSELLVRTPLENRRVVIEEAAERYGTAQKFRKFLKEILPENEFEEILTLWEDRRKKERQEKNKQKKSLKVQIRQKMEQEAQPLAERHKQLKSELDQVFQNSKKPPKIEEIEQRFRLIREIEEIERQLTVLKEKNIKAITHTTPRAFKELPHFFKFPLIKIHPRRPKRITQEGRTYLEEIKETINFQQVKAEITYYGGELGDQDRMVWLAIINQAIRNREFVKEFGWIPYSLEDIANEIGISGSDSKRNKVRESLERLRLTDVKFNSSFGDFAFKGAFHLLDSVVSVESKKVRADINNKLQPPFNPVITQEFAVQAQTMLERIKAKTPKINLIRFHANLMDAILSHQITTIDLWAIKGMLSTEKTLFLYLYDISQWRSSADPLSITIHELIALLDLRPHIRKAKGKQYTEWNRSKEQIEVALIKIKAVLKHIVEHSWDGDGEKSVLLIQFVKNIKQIPSRPK